MLDNFRTGMRNVNFHAILSILVCFIILCSNNQGHADNFYLNVTPLGWDYGNVPVGISATVTFDFESLGPSEVWIYYSFLNETKDEVPPLANPLYKEYNLGAFSFDPLTFPTFPLASRPGEHNLVDVIFTPASPGHYSVYLGIISNDCDLTPGPNAYFLLEGTGTVPSVPEPATMILFGTGLAGLAAVGRRKRI